MVRVLTIASTDSHLKWSMGQRGRMPADWVGDVVVLRGDGAPSERQIDGAVGDLRPGLEVVPTVSLAGVRRLCRRFAPDVLILACPGPVVEALAMVGVGRLPSSPVIVAATPGIAMPVTTSAITTRRIVDVFIAHGRAERRAYAEAFSTAGCSTDVAMSRLPSLLEPRPLDPDGRVLFAPQALVPAARDERRALLDRLRRASHDGIVVHERTVAGESTAHRERDTYRSILDEMVAVDPTAGDDIRFVNGPMAVSIRKARCVVTVSSTAAIEAASAGVPIGIVRDFGVDDTLLNSVFVGSGCLVDLEHDGLTGVRRPDPDWADDHYLHCPTDDDWVERILARLIDGRQHRCRSRTVPHRGAKWIVKSMATSGTPDRK